MEAIVKHEAGVGVRMEDVPMPKIGANDLLVKVKIRAMMSGRSGKVVLSL